jgi:hypothetical protein
MQYFDTDGIKLTRNNTSSIIVLNVNGSGILCYWNDTGEKKVIYETLCEKYGDTSFNRTVKLYTSNPFRPTAQAYSFVSINIVSNTDYDESHLAGTSLNDLVMINYKTFKPFIDSGYNGYEGLNDYQQYSTAVQKTVSEIETNDLMLLNAMKSSLNDYSIAFLAFEETPTLSKEHLITVTCTDDRGQVFSDSIQMTFE